MCAKNGIKLLIIDSLAGLVRTEYEVGGNKSTREIVDRTEYLFRFAQSLKWLADTFQLCIVVVNQVTAVGFDQQSQMKSSSSSFMDLKPALGLAWSTCVNTRIMLYRDSADCRVTGVWGSDEDSKMEEKENEENRRRNCEAQIQSGCVDRAASSSGSNARTTNVHTQQEQQQEEERGVKIKYLGSTSKRYISMEFSPLYPKRFCRYEITPKGIQGIPT